MGLRINPYLIFKTLSSKRSSSRVENEVFDYFEKFNAIAFVIHDPLLHIEFDSYLQNKFEELDEVTGEKLLFFIFNQGSADTKSPFSKLKTNLDLYEGQEVTDDVFSSQSFAQELGIDNSELPCILISNDYNARKFVYKPIIQKEEVFILQKLANYLNASNTLDYNVLMQKFHFIHGNVELDISIARSLTNEFTFNSTKATNSEKATLIESKLKYFKWLKHNNSNNLDFQLLIEKLALQIVRYSSYKRNEINDSYITINEPHINYNLLPSSEVFNKVQKVPNSQARPQLLTLKDPLSRFVNINKYYFENESIKFLKAAELACSAFDQSDEEPDYSPCAIVLGKAFEKEISSSIVNLIRNNRGIEMPEFYNKFKPAYLVKVTPIFDYGVGFEIDLNKNKKGIWIPPPMGQSLLAFKEFTRINGHGTFISRLQYYQLISAWKKLGELRNMSSHIEEFPKEKFVDMLFYLFYLSNHNQFKILYKIKEYLRS